jgi:hypothetical protein
VTTAVPSAIQPAFAERERLALAYPRADLTATLGLVRRGNPDGLLTPGRSACRTACPAAESVTSLRRHSHDASVADRKEMYLGS